MKPFLHLATLILLLTYSGAGDWSGFRGADGNGVADDAKPPVSWSEDENVIWKVQLPGPGASSPIVWGERVYLTSHSGYGLGAEERGEMEKLVRHLSCFDLSDGKLLWQVDLAAKLPESRYFKRMEWHGYASHTPAADGDGVYCFFGKSGVHAFTHEGKPRWQASVGDGTHGWGSAASPVLVGDLVVVNAFAESGALVALDRESGEERWRFEGLKEAWDTPAVVRIEDGGTELAIGVVGKILGIEASSGKQLWSCEAADWYIVASPIVHDGVVYSLSGKGFEAATAVRAGGRGDVTATHRLWQTRKGSNVSSPLYYQGRIYFAHDQGSLFYCLDAATGETIYQERLPQRFGVVYGSPVIADGKIFLHSRQGGAVVIEPGDTFKIVSQNPPLDRSPVNSCPAVVGDRLLIRSDSYLYCIGAKDR